MREAHQQGRHQTLVKLELRLSFQDARIRVSTLDFRLAFPRMNLFPEVGRKSAFHT